MALRTIRTEGDPVLNKVSRDVKEMTPRIKTLIEDMIDTLYDSNGVGLAAPQVGVLRRIVVIDIGDEGEEVEDLDLSDEDLEAETKEVLEEAGEEEFQSGPIVMINPMILEYDGEQTGEEGCLSVPGKYGIVTRPNYVKAWALDDNMDPFEIEGEGLMARAICHELDHLDGHIYTELVEGELHDAVAEQKAYEEEFAKQEAKKAKEAARKSEAAKRAKGK